MLQAKYVSPKRSAFLHNHSWFNVSLRNVHTDTRVCLTDDACSNGYLFSYKLRSVPLDSLNELPNWSVSGHILYGKRCLSFKNHDPLDKLKKVLLDTL